MSFAAKILADSLSPDGVRLTTFEVTFPRIILSEWNTHRMFSRNSASSRAIPVEKMIKRVQENPYIPTHWGKNQKGMQADVEVDEQAAHDARLLWEDSQNAAVESAKKLLELGIHKQITNRLLEPFMWHTVIVTATEWDNFFHLRDNPQAHPEIQKIAQMMRELYEASVPKPLGYGEWHLPLVQEEELHAARRRLANVGVPSVVDTSQQYKSDVPEIQELIEEAIALELDVLKKISVARCARVSYLTHDGKRDIQADLDLHDKLLTSGHMCFDAETEVLTRGGWKSWPTVTLQDAVFAVDPVTGYGTFETPQRLHSYRLQEPMYRVYGQQLDLQVTMNHRMLVKARRNDGTWTPYGFEQAREVQGKPRRYLKSANFSGHGDVPSYDRSTEFMRLLGFFVGDGYAVGGNQAGFHLRKRRKIEYLKSLGFPVRALENDKYVVELPGVGKWLRDNCYGEDGQKRIPAWVLGLTEAQALALFDGLKNSDGSVRRKTWVYATTSKQVADMLQALLHVHGKVGSLSFVDYGHATKMAIRVNVSDRIAPRVEPNQEGRSLSYVEEVVPYDGLVYCATTSTGALMVRRRGHVVVSGNSPFEHVARPATVADEKLALRKMVGVFPKESLQKDLWFGNLRGWVSARKLIPNEHDILGTPP